MKRAPQIKNNGGEMIEEKKFELVKEEDEAVEDEMPAGE